MSEEFNKEQLEYTVNVKEGTKSIEIFAEKEVETSIMTGDGLHNIDIGENDILITVTSESGSVRTYKIKVIRKISSNTNIIDIIPSTGILDKKFSNDISDYTLNVSKNITPHTFRHTRAIHLLKSGVPVIMIRDLLGHESVITTEEYAKVLEEI